MATPVGLTHLPVTSRRKPVPSTCRLLKLSVRFVYFIYLLIYYVAAKATYIRLLFWQKGGFSALAP